MHSKPSEKTKDSLQIALQRLREIFEQSNALLDKIAAQPFADTPSRTRKAAATPVAHGAQAAAPASSASKLVATDRAGGTSPALSGAATKTPWRLAPVDAWHLLNLASQAEGRIAPHERQLALDLLTLALPGMDATLLEELAARLCHMEAPPSSLVRAFLTYAPARLRQRILESAAVPERVLCETATSGSEDDRLAIARRRGLTPALCATIARHAQSATLRRLLENSQARLGDMAWRQLMHRAHGDGALLASMVARDDLPPAVAHDIFWPATTGLRRRILLRYGSESAAMDRLLALVDTGGPNRSHESLTHMQAVYAALEENDPEEAILLVAREARIGWETARRILRDRGGEALVVLLKARGASLGHLRQLLLFLQERRIARRWTFVHETDRLEDLFGRISRNRARLALLYWDWRCQALGPYGQEEPEALPQNDGGSAPAGS